MADDTKSALGSNHFEEVVFLLAGLIIFGVIVTRFFEYLDSMGGVGSFWDKFLALLAPYWAIWKVIAILMSGAAIIWAAYSRAKLQDVIKEDHKIYGAAENESVLDELKHDIEPEKKNPKWERVQALANSNNSSDWHMAILEADILLDEALRTLGYMGDGLGEILKSVDKSDLLTLDNAWEAHKVRNRVAHDGAAYQLTERETRRVISMYESVFKEMQLI